MEFKNLDKYTNLKMFLFFQFTAFESLISSKLAKKYKNDTLDYIDFMRNRKASKGNFTKCKCNNNCGK